MTEARKLPKGRLLVPVRAETDNIIGDGMLEIGPGDPDYEGWLEWFKQQEERGEEGA